MNNKLLPFFKKICRAEYSFWLLLIAMCTVLEFSGMAPALRFDRYLIEAGQWYRLLTAHSVHLNDMHLLMNMLGVLLVMFFFSSQLKVTQWVILILMSSLVVSLGLLLFNPEVKHYVGLSGVLHGLFIVGAISEIRRFPVSGWLLLAVLIAKLIWEQLNGAMPGSESVIKGHVLVDSHLYGAIGGLLFLAITYGLKKIR